MFRFLKPNWRIAAVSIVLLWTCGAHGKCDIRLSTPVVHLGRSFHGAFAPSDFVGYRQVGSLGVAVVAISCDAARPEMRLRIGNLAGVDGRLLQWGASAVGAVRLRAARATADGIPVNLITDGCTPASTADIVKNDTVLAFDLAPLPHGGRNFSMEWEITGLVSEDFVPISIVGFALNPRLQLIEP